MGCRKNAHSGSERPVLDPNAEATGRWSLTCSRCGRTIKASNLADLGRQISWPGNRRR